jgi:hypothetical protein
LFAPAEHPAFLVTAQFTGETLPAADAVHDLGRKLLLVAAAQRNTRMAAASRD